MKDETHHQQPIDGFRYRSTHPTNNKVDLLIISDSPAFSVEGVKIEANDQINISDPLRIDFNLQVERGFQDGINFRFPVGASLSINLEGSTEETTSLIQIGSKKWSVSQLPLDLSGW